MPKEELITTLQKNADKARNKMIIPKFFIDKYGYSFYMEIYEDKLVIKPMKKKEN